VIQKFFVITVLMPLQSVLLTSEMSLLLFHDLKWFFNQHACSSCTFQYQCLS